MIQQLHAQHRRNRQMATLHSSRGLAEDRLPLLTNQEDALEDDAIEVEFHGSGLKKRGGRSTDALLGNSSSSSSDRDKSSRHGVSFSSASEPAAPSRRKKHYSGSEMIVAVFVVAFDIKKGNDVEWKYPSEVPLEEVEFKSMASGLHHVEKDFIYFKQNQLYGLSCFERIPVANQEERQVRMKSVGLLAVGYSDLHLHMDFLQRQVRVQVETPGEYGSLEEYFRHYRSPQQIAVPPRTFSEPGLLGPDDLPNLTVLHPAGCFSKFLHYFGAKLFVLWKLTLLKKRVILFSPPPIGAGCHKVYCMCLLPCHALPLDNIDTEPNPQFYVNVSDLSHLETLDHYIACTTEKIFQVKTKVYDIYVDQQTLTASRRSLEPLLRVTQMDQDRFREFNDIRANRRMSVGGAGSRREDDNLGFAEYFQELNSQLFRTVCDAASSEDHVLTVEMVESIGLHPVKDRLFLTELATTYDLNFTVQRPVDMFSCCL